MRRRLWNVPWDWMLFAGAVFIACCCLHIGLSGKYSDDYSITMRNLATGGVDWSLHPWAERYPYFWRPLHLALLWGVGTAFWNHDWVAHALSALAHGGCALMLGVWLKRMGLSTRVSVLAGLVFMTNTLHAEAINWFSTICVSLGALTMLWVLELGRRVGASGASASWWRVSAMAGLSFAAACWYESSAAGLLALPLVMIATRPSGEALATGVRRAFVPTAACGLACVLYAALLVGTAPAWQRGSAARMAGTTEFVGRIAWIGEQWGEWLVGQRGRDLWIGAWIEGRQWIVSPAGVVLGSVLIAAGVGAMWAWRREGVREEATVRGSAAQAGRLCHGRAGLGWLLLAGAAVFLGAWLPIIAVKDNSVELRTWYTPLVGLVILAACGLEWFMRVLARKPRRVWRVADGVLGLGVISLVLAGALAHMGWQRVFVRVWENDEKRAAQIVAAVPSPPKDAVIMPLFTRAREASTGRRYFDFAVEGGLSQTWSSWAMMQRAYKRRDITATHLSARTPEERALREVSERGVWSTVNLVGDFERSTKPEGGSFVPWDRVVAVKLLADGGVEFCRKVVVERVAGEDVIARPALCQAQTNPLMSNTSDLIIRDPDGEWGRRIARWRMRGADGVEREVPLVQREASLRVMELDSWDPHSAYAIWVDIPASAHYRRAVLRWSGQLLIGETKSTSELLSLRIRVGLASSRGQGTEEPTWVCDPAGPELEERASVRGRCEVDVPPSAEPRRLVVEMYGSSTRRCRTLFHLDPGWLIDQPNPPDSPGKAAAPGDPGPEYTPPTPGHGAGTAKDGTE